MRITLEPSTNQDDRSADAAQHHVCIEHPYDDLELSTVLELLEFALKAYGYQFDGQLDFFDQAAIPVDSIPPVE